MPVEFSVVIPTYRRPQQLREAIASVLAQTGVTTEIIVIDDCPDGSARDVANGFGDSRINYLINPSPTGGIPSIVRNLGWPLAKGTFIHFLDDDDIVPEGHYAAVKEVFSEHPNVGIVFGHIEPFGDCPKEQLEQERAFFADAARRAASCQRFGPKWSFVGRMLFDRILLVCSSSVLRRQCVEKIGGFDPGIRLMEDGEFHLRAMRECGAYFLDRVTVRYRIGSPSLMHSPTPSPAQIKYELEGRRLMNDKYRREKGFLEFYALAVFTKVLRKIRIL